MHYAIAGLCPRTDISMGRHGFLIRLYPDWKRLVLASSLDQEKVELGLSNMGESWLDACGYDGYFDPDNCGFKKDKSLPPGPEARRTYMPNRDLRITWGEWGPEHITVPGNACGLDLSRSSFGSPEGGMTLVPHNIDTVFQKMLLLIVFTHFAETMSMGI